VNIYCILEFKEQYEKLLKKKAYKSIEESLFEYLFNKNIDDLKSGTKLNSNSETPYIKKRIEGRGGFRLYYLLAIIKENVYLIYLHPKKGSLGMENIPTAKRTELLKQTYESIRQEKLYSVKFDSINKKCSFEKLF